MKLVDLSSSEIKKALCNEGLSLLTPPFSTRFFSDCPRVIQGISSMYRDFQLSKEKFADFDVHIRHQRRWYKPQAQFYFDDFSPFLPLPSAQDYAMLEWGLNWCYANHSHQYLVLHAAVIACQDRAVIMPGFPGAGKSTLTAELMLNGWRLFSDELALIDEAGKLIAAPRPVSLKNASIDIISQRHPDALFTKPAKDTNKGTVAHLKLEQSEAIEHCEASPFVIVFPKYVANSELNTQYMDPAEALVSMAEQGFNYHILGAEGFRRLSMVVEQSRCFKLEYSSLDDAVAWFTELSGASCAADL
ncbi:HprK-related kinase A [Pleionea sp. CnH1-48]|uniref:HprK-related kinase A n=1 Tax=Pleionea sp. CnH1-48 TaxID=2954494 RepID=UPI002096BEBE|nr:HprK-related kinase A [Pleionea sp. CnH1-48]MCO7227117.1 HprK-related kinase A [Pleionea sp. CnH1-48]